MRFTNNELKEIEKQFDIKAGEILGNQAHLTNALTKIKSEKLDAHLSKIFDESVDAFDIYRTISAKCNFMMGDGDK